MSFLLDTDICSAHLKQKGPVSNRFLQYSGGLHISTITLGELYAWAARAAAPASRLDGLREMLHDLTVLEITSDVAEKYGRLQAGLLDIGRPAPGMDLMMHNTHDFVNIPHLRIVDWLAP